MYGTQVYRMKTIFNHRTTISSDVQPFGELSNFQFLNTSISSSGNHCCCISLPLKMIRGCKYRLLAEIYSMIVVHLRRPGSFLKVLRFSAIPSIRPLAFIPCIRLILSIFHRSAYMIFLMAGRSRSGNHTWIASVVAPLIRAASIQRVWRVLTCVLRRKNPSNQCFPTLIDEPPVKRIRLANVRICVCVGTRLKMFWIRIHSASRLSYIGDSFCWNVYAVVFGCRPANRWFNVVRGML